MSDLSSQNRKWLEAKVRRDRQFLTLLSATIIIAGTLLYVWTAYMVVPALERVERHFQQEARI